jgi:hypothetical protein
MNAEIVASKAACSKLFHPKVGTHWVDIYNLHRLFYLVNDYEVLYNKRKKLVDLNKRFMDSQEHYYTGNSKQANLLLNEILPVLEDLILNANKDFFTIQDTMRVLSISRTQLYYLRNRGLLESKTVGRKVYITKEAIRKLIMNSDIPT